MSLSVVPEPQINYVAISNRQPHNSQEEIKSRPKSGNACCHSSLLSITLKIKVYRTTVLPIVLYGCETWSLALREERRLRVFENKVLRRIFGPRKDDVIGEWRKLHNEQLNP